MKHLKLFEDFVNEWKNVGVLYHYTTPRGLVGILAEDKMSSGHQHISFSRNPDLKQWYEDYGACCRIAFNGSSLSDKFHIEPYLFDPSKDPLFGGGTVSDPELRRKYYRHEMEERIPLPDVKGIKKYIIQVDILKSCVSHESDLKHIKTAMKNEDVKIQWVNKFVPVKILVPSYSYS